LNPYRLWWAVVLIVGLSLAGHVAIRFTGPERGMFWTGVLAGLASSTAATLALSRRARDQPGLLDSAIAGSLAACGVMFLRMAAIVALMDVALGVALGAPLAASGVALLALGVLQHRRAASRPVESVPDGVAPFDLSMALGFGVFLGLMTVLTHGAKAWLGDTGLYGLAALTGLVDVDAIVVSISRMHASASASTAVAILAIGIAAVSNSLAKSCIAWWIGGPRMGRRVVLGNALAAVVGVCTATAIAAW
jgi:uncharacterized membrane protein (DUF4010 family)